MSSWFNVESITKSVTDAINVESIKEMTDKVQNKVQESLSKIDSEMLEKLTLSTPELTAERQRIDAEEKRKEQVRDSLAGLLPWETRDPERDILVEECRDAMLQLSQHRESFFGPYPMPKRRTEEKEEKEEDEESGKDKPTADSLEKLAKLEPLPTLLQEFDLDAHVGLINRLLKEDKDLVEMQSELSSGGERERIFWRNYFFHCAFTRYEAGMSIDEIWSDQPPVFAEPEAAAPASEKVDDHEETITFDEEEPEKAFPAEPTTDHDAPFSKDTPSVSASSGTQEGATDFEMVADNGEESSGNDDNQGGEEMNLDACDYELDELEAEIARELED